MWLMGQYLHRWCPAEVSSLIVNGKFNALALGTVTHASELARKPRISNVWQDNTSPCAPPPFLPFFSFPALVLAEDFVRSSPLVFWFLFLFCFNEATFQNVLICLI